MNVIQAAAYLTQRGYRHSAGTVRALARAGRINHVVVGVGRGRIEISPADLERYITAATDAPEPAPPKPARRERPAKPAPKVVAAEDWRAGFERAKRA